MGSRKKQVKRTPQEYHEAAVSHMNQVATRIMGVLEYKAGKQPVEAALGIIAKDLQFVVNIVREMKSVLYANAVPQGKPAVPSTERFPKTMEPSPQGGNTPLGAAPLCYKCSQHRDANVHINEGFIGYHEYVPTPEPRMLPIGMPKFAGPPALYPMQDIHERLKALETETVTHDMTLRIAKLEERCDINRDAVAASRKLLSERISELEARVSAVLERLSLQRTGEGNVAMYAKAAKKKRGMRGDSNI